MITVGIDPGNSGAYAVVGVNGDVRHIVVKPMPTTQQKLTTKTKSGNAKTHTELDIHALATDLHAVITDMVSTKKVELVPLVFVCEQVGAMPGQGVVSMFNFGDSFGQLKALGRLFNHDGIRPSVMLVRPQSWKKTILAGTAKDKDAAVNYVKNKHPTVSLLPTERSKVPHEGMAEAVCIAEWGISNWRA